MNPDTFYLEEYKALKIELLGNLDGIVKLETFFTVGTVAFYAWYATHSLGGFIWWTPVLLWLFGWYRTEILLKRMDHLSEYIRTRGAESIHQGWETFLHENPKSSLKRSVRLFWLISLVVIVGVPFLLWRSLFWVLALLMAGAAFWWSHWFFWGGISILVLAAAAALILLWRFVKRTRPALHSSLSHLETLEKSS